MSESAIRKVWSLFALTLLTLSVLFFLRTTGVAPKDDIFGILGYRPTTIAVLALPVDIVLLILVSALTWFFSHRSKGRSFTSRFPIFYFDSPDIDTTTTAGRWYQRCVFALFLVLPLVLTGQMFSRFLDGAVHAEVKKDEFEVITWSGRAHFSAPKAPTQYAGYLRFGEKDGPEYRLGQAVAYVVALAVAVILWVTAILSLSKYNIRGLAQLRGL